MHVLDAHFVQVIPKDAATMMALQKSVSGNVLFTHLEADELTHVLDAMFLVAKEAGETVMQQGDEGDNFYIIGEGTVEVGESVGVCCEIRSCACTERERRKVEGEEREREREREREKERERERELWMCRHKLMKSCLLFNTCTPHPVHTHTHTHTHTPTHNNTRRCGLPRTDQQRSSARSTRAAALESLH